MFSFIEWDEIFLKDARVRAHIKQMTLTTKTWLNENLMDIVACAPKKPVKMHIIHDNRSPVRL